LFQAYFPDVIPLKDHGNKRCQNFFFNFETLKKKLNFFGDVVVAMPRHATQGTVARLFP
jgi:hypothetical protein